mgnify:CR=1 FL=1
MPFISIFILADASMPIIPSSYAELSFLEKLWNLRIIIGYIQIIKIAYNDISKKENVIKKYV